jgi:ATP-binding cassette subfamily B protein
MPQGAPMFKRSVFENMIYYAKDTTMETVQDILKRFQLENHFPNGLDTLATSLSGGQRQLVWFVRIYLKNADLIVMDEPTSSLDQGTKQIFVEKMNEMFAEKTVIVVTHDPYLSKHMRRVVDIGSINKMNSKST